MKILQYSSIGFTWSEAMDKQTKLNIWAMHDPYNLPGRSRQPHERFASRAPIFSIFSNRSGRRCVALNRTSVWRQMRRFGFGHLPAAWRGCGLDFASSASQDLKALGTFPGSSNRMRYTWALTSGMTRYQSYGETVRPMLPHVVDPLHFNGGLEASERPTCCFNLALVVLIPFPEVSRLSPCPAIQFACFPWRVSLSVAFSKKKQIPRKPLGPDALPDAEGAQSLWARHRPTRSSSSGHP